MSRSPESHNDGELNRAIIKRGYLTSKPVQDRFKLNEFAIPYVDLEARSVKALELDGSRKRILDIGAADASFLHRCLKWGVMGQLIGIEPNTTQSEYWRTPINPELLAMMLDGTNEPSSERIDELREMAKVAIDTYRIRMIEGHAGDLSRLKDNSADVIYARNMLYYLTPEEREQFYKESRRVLGPDGVAVIATSDDDNKPVHRGLEQATGRKLTEILPDVRVAPAMNAGYTTRDARRELVQHFGYAYALMHRATMRIETPDEVEALMNSLRSMRTQYSVEDGRPPTVEEFDWALDQVALPHILGCIRRKGAYYDKLRRSEFIVSNVPQDRARLAEYGFHVIRHADSLKPPIDQA